MRAFMSTADSGARRRVETDNSRYLELCREEAMELTVAVEHADRAMPGWWHTYNGPAALWQETQPSFPGLPVPGFIVEAHQDLVESLEELVEVLGEL